MPGRYAVGIRVNVAKRTIAINGDANKIELVDRLANVKSGLRFRNSHLVSFMAKPLNFGN
jgi:hypothetical protein